MELPGRPGGGLDVETRGLWVDGIPHLHCVLKATLALDSYESVSGTEPLENLRSCHGL